MIREPFIEIAIYRCDIDQYHAEYEHALARYVAAGNSEDLARTILRGLGWRGWDYNQTVGWLQLAAESQVVKGYLWWTTAKRVVQLPAEKRTECEGKALEIRFVGTETVDEVLAELRTELNALGRTLGKRHLDLRAFDRMAPYVDWARLLWLEEAWPGRC